MESDKLAYSFIQARHLLAFTCIAWHIKKLKKTKIMPALCTQEIIS